eukprot:SAG31_NODE_34958_length_327_cov_1.140351_1_plen_49_part_01
MCGRTRVPRTAQPYRTVGSYTVIPSEVMLLFGLTAYRGYGTSTAGVEHV